MASILVYIDRDGGRPGAASCRVLGEARRLATRVGATLYAVALIPQSRADSEPWIETLGQCGADKIVLVNAQSLAGPPIWSTHGPVLGAIARQIRPLLAAFPNGAPARELAPRLAAHLSAAFVPDAALLEDPRAVVVSRIVGRRTCRTLDLDQLGQTVVATFSAGSDDPPRGEDDADVVFFDPPEDAGDAIELLSTEDDPEAALARARVVVTAGAGVQTDSAIALCRQLADALGGELATTRQACRRGLGARSRVVGVDGQRVSPALYIACGASGSDAHLGGVSPRSVIVAVNSDPDAPIFRVANYGLVGEVSQVVPQLIEQARRKVGS